MSIEIWFPSNFGYYFGLHNRKKSCEINCNAENIRDLQNLLHQNTFFWDSFILDAKNPEDVCSHRRMHETFFWCTNFRRSRIFELVQLNLFMCLASFFSLWIANIVRAWKNLMISPNSNPSVTLFYSSLCVRWRKKNRSNQCNSTERNFCFMRCEQFFILISYWPSNQFYCVIRKS